MKAKLNQNMKNEKPGKGHQVRIALLGKATTDVDGTKTNFDIDWSFTLTVEQIDYAVKLVAGRLAAAMNKVAGAEIAEETVTA